MYADTDVYPGELPLDHPSSGILFDQDLPTHQLFIDHNSQNTGLIGNDFFVATIDNLVIGEIRGIAEANYDPDRIYYSEIAKRERKSTFKYFKSDAPLLRAYNYDKTNRIESDTPAMTGPVCVQDIVKSIQSAEKKPAQIIAINPHLRSVRKQSDEGVNDRSWMHMPITHPPAELTLLQQKQFIFNRVIETIRFEVNYMYFLRLDDHIANVLEALQQPSAEIESTITQFLHALDQASGIDYTKVRAIQITGRYIASETFYKQKSLFGIQHALPSLDQFDFDEIELEYAANQFNIGEFYRTHSDRLKESNPEIDHYYKQLLLDIAGGLSFIKKAIEFFNENILKELKSTIDKTKLTNLVKYFSRIQKSFDLLHTELDQLRLLPHNPAFVSALKLECDIIQLQLTKIQDQIPKPTKEEPEAQSRGFCRIL